jgi:D-alanine-D-alanine ligase
MKTVVVLFGGRQSPEHDVSIVTGLQMLGFLKNLPTYRAIPVYEAMNGTWWTGAAVSYSQHYHQKAAMLRRATPVVMHRHLTKGVVLTMGQWWQTTLPVHAVLLALHGGPGETGAMQGFLSTLGVPFTSAAHGASYVSMNKWLSKCMLQHIGIPITPYYVAHQTTPFDTTYEALLRTFQTEAIVVKPNIGGSSIGVNQINLNDKAAVHSAINTAFVLDVNALIEEAVSYTHEINLSVLHTLHGYQLSAAESVGNHTLLDFDQKYLTKSSKKGMEHTHRTIPANIPDTLLTILKADALTIAHHFDIRGVARIDFLVNVTQQSRYVLEVNMIPGSLSHYLWSATNTTPEQLLTTLIDTCLAQPAVQPIPYAKIF